MEETKHEETAPASGFSLGLERITLGIAAASLCLLVILNALNVIGRTFLSTPFTWIDEAMSFVMVLGVFSGALAATSKSCHIKVDILYQFLSRSMQKLVFALGTLVSIVILGTLGLASTKIVSILRQFDQRSDAMEFPIWIVQSIVPIFLFVSVALLVYKAVRVFSRSYGKKGV